VTSNTCLAEQRCSSLDIYCLGNWNCGTRS